MLKAYPFRFCPNAICFTKISEKKQKIFKFCAAIDTVFEIYQERAQEDCT